MADAPTQKFPLVFRWLDDGVFVTSAANEYAQALGTRLIAMGDTPIDEVMRQLGTLIAHNNQQWLHYYGAQYLPYQPVLKGLGILPDTPASKLTFRTLAGQEFTLDVLPGTAPLVPALSPATGALPLYLQNGGLNYWFTYSAPLRLLYFKYNSCREMAGSPFADFTDQLLNTLDTNPVDTLVLDFRGNVGGDSSIVNPLVLGLEQRAGTLFANPNFVAYDVIDKGTFSSGTTDAIWLKSLQLQAAAANPGRESGEKNGGDRRTNGRLTRRLGERPPIHPPLLGVDWPIRHQSLCPPAPHSRRPVLYARYRHPPSFHRFLRAVRPGARGHRGAFAGPAAGAFR